MSMTPRAGLQIAGELAAFIEVEALPGTGLEADAFWAGVAAIFARFAPENRRLLAVRDDLQTRIDAWHCGRRGAIHDGAASEAFLREIGYLVDAPAPFAIGTRHVDAEVATLAGPQLVVPSLNARFVLNAANARWGSLYDALYGTDALGDLPPPGPFDAARGRGSWRGPRPSSTRRCRWPRGHGPIWAIRTAASRSAIPASTSDIARADGCSGTMGCISRWFSTGIIRSAGTIRRGSPMWCWSQPCRRSSIWKTPSPPWMPPTRLRRTGIGWA